MDLIFITDNRFVKNEKNEYYTHDISFGNTLWDRYLKHFDSVDVVGRVFKHLETLSPNNLVTNVNIIDMPPFTSPLSFYRNRKKIEKKLTSYLSDKKDSAIIIRGGGALCYLASKVCNKMKLPYGMEVIGDPYDVFAQGVIKHPLRPIFRYLFTKIQKKMVLGASSVIYVTKYALQNRYPSRYGAYTTYASDVFINEIKGHIKTAIDSQPIRLISIGSLDQMYKSPDVALNVIHNLISKGIDVELTWLGKGVYMEQMIQLSKELGIHDKVHFLGAVSSDEVNKQLDLADIFILLSKTEGLPRAMVEAMSRGLPCIGTRVGGIPELLDDDCLVSVNNADAVCEIVKKMNSDKIFYQKQSQVNLEKSKEYLQEYLEDKRLQFFKYIKDLD